MVKMLDKGVENSAISSEAKEMLEGQVKKGKDRKFILICKGAAIKTLIVFKKGPFGPKIVKAKKEGFRGQAVCGVISGKGVHLTFHMPGTSEVSDAMKTEGNVYHDEPCKLAKLRQFFKEEGGMQFKPEFQIVTRLTDIHTVNETDEDREVGERRKAAESKGAEQLKQQLSHVLIKKLIPLARQAFAVQPSKREEILGPPVSIKEALSTDQLDVAKREILEYGALLKQIIAGETAPVTPSSAPPSPPPLAGDEPRGKAGKKVKNQLAELTRLGLNAEHETYDHQYSNLGKLANDLKNDSSVSSKERKQRIRTIVKQVDALAVKIAKRIADYKRYLKARDKTRGRKLDLAALNTAHRRYDKPLEDILFEVEVDLVNESPPDYSRAANRLSVSGVDKTYKEQLKKAKTDRENELADTRYKPVYEDKVRRINEGIAYLEKMPGTKDQVTKLKDLLKAGKNEARPGNYQTAYKKLTGLNSSLKAGEQASKKFASTAGGDKFQNLRAQAEKRIKDYAKIAGLADPETIDKARVDLQDALKILDTQRGKDPEGDAKHKALQVILRIDLKITAVKEKQRLCKDLNNNLNRIWYDLPVMATTKDYAPILDRWRTTDTLLKLHNYTEAEPLLKALDKDAWALYHRLWPDYNAWCDLEKKIDAEHLPLALKANNLQFLEKQANSIRGRLKWCKDTAPVSHDFTEVLKVARTAIEEIDTLLKPRLQAHKDLQGERDAAQKKFDDQRNIVTTRLKDLEEAEGDVKAFEDRINSAASKLKRMYAVEKADAIQTIFDEARTALVATLNDIEDILGDEEVLEKYVATSKDKKLRAQYAKIKAAVRKELDYLLEEGYAKLAELKSEVDIVDSRIELQERMQKPFLERFVTDMQAVGTLVAKAKQEQTQLRSADKTKGKKAAKARQKELAEVRKKFGKFKAYLDGFGGDIDDCLAMLESSAAVIVKNAVTRLEGEVKDQLAALAANTDLQKVVDDLKALASQVNDANLKKCMDTRYRILKGRLEQEIKTDCYASEPSHALTKVLAPFKTEVEQAVNEAGKRQARRTKIDERVKELGTKMARQKALFANAPSVKKGLVGQLKSATTVRENSETQSENLLAMIEKRLDLLIEDAKSGDGKLCLQWEQQERQAEQANLLAKEKWDSTLAIFWSNEWRQAEQAYRSHPVESCDESRWEALKKAMDQAKKTGSKQGLYDIALKQLDQARTLAREFAANPLNAKATGLVWLGRLSRRWKMQVRLYVKDVNNLVKKIKETVANDSSIDVGKATAPLTSIAHGFDPAIFDDAIDDLESKEDVATRRKAKEEGLRYVRSYQRLLARDPVLALVQEDNP